MKKLTILLFSILISFNSYGEWMNIYKGPDGTTVNIDIDTIKKHDGHVYWWILWDLLKPTVETSPLIPNGTMSLTTYSQGDCGIYRLKRLSSYTYKHPMGGGTGDKFDPLFPYEWIYPAPKSLKRAELELSCLLSESSKEYPEQNQLVIEILNNITEILTEQADRGTKKELQEDYTDELKISYINQIASRVKSFWRYQGAEDYWSCQVYVLQDMNGEVQSVYIQSCDIDNSDKARSFKNSIERAIYKSSPLPTAPDENVFDREIFFEFSVD